MLRQYFLLNCFRMKWIVDFYKHKQDSFLQSHQNVKRRRDDNSLSDSDSIWLVSIEWIPFSNYGLKIENSCEYQTNDIKSADTSRNTQFITNLGNFVYQIDLLGFEPLNLLSSAYSAHCMATNAYNKIKH